jgi:hypothetical protein
MGKIRNVKPSGTYGYPSLFSSGVKNPWSLPPLPMRLHRTRTSLPYPYDIITTVLVRPGSAELRGSPVGNPRNGRVHAFRSLLPGRTEGEEFRCGSRAANERNVRMPPGPVSPACCAPGQPPVQQRGKPGSMPQEPPRTKKWIGSLNRLNRTRFSPAACGRRSPSRRRGPPVTSSCLSSRLYVPEIPTAMIATQNEIKQ